MRAVPGRLAVAMGGLALATTVAGCGSTQASNASAAAPASSAAFCAPPAASWW